MSSCEIVLQPNQIEVTPEKCEIQAGCLVGTGGTHEQGDGVTFALFSRNATGVRLELYGHPDDSSPTRIIDLDSSPASYR